MEQVKQFYLEDPDGNGIEVYRDIDSKEEI